MSRSGSGVSGQKQEWSGLVRIAKDGSEAWWKCHVTEPKNAAKKKKNKCTHTGSADKNSKTKKPTIG